jgi:hypothetical protein
MAGKAIGEFSFKAVTIKYSPGPAGSVLVEPNWEGTAAGFGTVFDVLPIFWSGNEVRNSA